MVPKTGRITAVGRKLWNVLLCKAQSQGLEQELFALPLKEVLIGLDFNSNNLALVKDHLRSMVVTPVEWQSPTTGEGPAWSVCGMLAEAKLYKERGEVWLSWSYAVSMRHELLDPDVFAKLSLEIISQLTSHAALVLYEVGTRYKEVGKTARQAYAWWMPVLIGRPFDERMEKLEYRIFKRDVLRPAIAQVNTITDVDVELIEHKTGRFVTELQFQVRKKPQRSLSLQKPSEPVDVALFVRAEKLGVEHARAEQLAAEFGDPALATALDALEKRLASQFPEPLRDPFRYLKSLMPGHAAAKVREHQVKVEAQAPEAIEVAAQARMGLWAQKWVAARNDQIVAEILALPKVRQDELTRALIDDLDRQGAHPTFRQSLLTKGWRHPIVRHRMVAYYAAGAYGPDWEKPTPEQLLEVAAQSAQAGPT
ncbi:replication initiation protein [Variovorax saccharolyticus]|uniref:replication initiation protein n=1 Tax=Variovorax saccharolyticus TaxID=3053516 RepID=UPI002575BEC9|nr:replication initiation protein [Variovorax sp. J31P216]